MYSYEDRGLAGNVKALRVVEVISRNHCVLICIVKLLPPLRPVLRSTEPVGVFASVAFLPACAVIQATTPLPRQTAIVPSAQEQLDWDRVGHAFSLNVSLTV